MAPPESRSAPVGPAIGENVVIPESAAIGPGCVIEEGVRIGERVYLQTESPRSFLEGEL